MSIVSVSVSFTVNVKTTSFFQSDDPVIQFRRNKSDACVPVGGYEIMWVDIYIPPGSLATYEVEAFGPGNLSQTQENTMFLCDLRLIQVSLIMRSEITFMRVAHKNSVRSKILRSVVL